MAKIKINTGAIAGYADMTPEQKVAALEAFELEDQSEDLTRQVAELTRKVTVNEHKASLLELGYEPDLAAASAEALADGKMDVFFANQRQHQQNAEKKLRETLLDGVPRPFGDGGSNTVTLEDLRKMSPQERYTFSVEHPDQYKELYGG